MKNQTITGINAKNIMPNIGITTAELENMVSDASMNEQLTTNKKYALLVDGDNISGDKAGLIMDEASRLGMVTIRNVYGNWMDNSLTKWKNAVSEYSLTPRQQFPNVAGKNATDSALIIEAMDILYREDVDGFIIVSSDSDYTSLAKRLRQSGKPVVGMGREQTHISFRKSCTRFITLKENGQDGADGCTSGVKERPSKVLEDHGFPDKTEIKSAIDRFLDEYDGAGNAIVASDLVNKLRNRYPDFSPRNYGYSKMSVLLKDWGYSIFLMNTNWYVECPAEVTSADSGTTGVPKLTENVLKKEIKAILRKSDHSEKVIISTIKDELVKKFPTFKIKDYGCKKMTELLKKLGFELVSDGNNKYVLNR